MRIYLIGMPGSGKSTLGRELALEMETSFIDLDDAIENKERKSINEIFSTDGEDVFRRIEAGVLREITISKSSFVMSTGGGVPCYHENIDFMNDHGITIYLEVSTQELESRLRTESQSRPLLAKVSSLKQAITKLLSDRRDFYQKASYTLESDSIALEDIKNLFSKM